MKGMKSIILLLMIMAFITVSIGMATAAVNVYVSATMPYSVLYQGDMTSANLSIQNNENYPVRIYAVGVNYDWMPDNVVSSVDFGGGYVQVESNGKASLGQLLIKCYDNVSTGYHSFYYNVNLNWYNSYSAAWVNETVVQPGTIFVDSPLKPQALQDLQMANQSLSSVKNNVFKSKRAIADIDNATSTLNDGWSAYNTNDFHRAINDSDDVVDLVVDANMSERDYQNNVSQVEIVVISVSDKLNSLKGTTDMAALNAINESNGYLGQAKQYIDAEDFAMALQYAQLADKSAENAVNLQFYSSLKENQTQAAGDSAQSAINAARDSLDNASDITSAAAKGILDNAKLKLADASSLFTQGDYANATTDANIVTSLVGQAYSAEASYRMTMARSMISSAGQPKSADAKDLLAKANGEYNLSRSDFNDNDFKDAAVHASNAYDMANQSAAAEQKSKGNSPLSAATPGFEAMAALLALTAIFLVKERKG